MTPHKTSRWVHAGFLVLLAACGQAAGAALPPTQTAAPTAAVPVQLSSLPTPSQIPATATQVATTYFPASAVTPLPSITAEPPFAVCSPLEGITLAELGQPDLLKNPFEAPRPGFDEGHHGADFAYWSRGDRKTMLGLPVKSVLAGRVAAVLIDRQPYGNAVIIETPLERFPRSWLAGLDLPALAPTVQPAPSLVCPPGILGAGPGDPRSLYLLYAHLNLPPNLALGEEAGCGQAVGGVGTTGRSVNYHLHLEARVGPSGVQFSEMAHYENSVTEDEMRNYCTWRVSGLFQLVDPLALIQALALQD